MSQFLSIQIDNPGQSEEELAAIAERLNVFVRKAMETETGELLAYIQNEGIPAAGIHRRTGRLEESGRATVSEEGGILTGTVSFGGTIPYAAVLNYGGLKTYDIFPVRAKALHFFARDGKEVFTRHVVHPPLKARNFMETSLEHQEETIIAGFTKAVEEALA